MKIFLIFANAICAGWAGLVFLYFLKFDPTTWAVVNISSIIQLLVAFALILGKRILMNVLIPFLLFYGAGGFFVFHWSLKTVPAHISHSIMVLTALYIIYLMITRWDIVRLVVGIALGIILFVPFRAYETHYLKSHPEIKGYFELFKGG